MSNSAGGRGSRGLSRVSIPDITRETIQNIKEIAGNHSDDEVYAVLRECSMDPNETAQKLLFQGPSLDLFSSRLCLWCCCMFSFNGSAIWALVSFVLLVGLRFGLVFGCSLWDLVL